ncbi:MAG: hypothetical protein WC635_03255 [Bacteriovorax sp.]
MHMTKKSLTSEAAYQYSFWSYCLAIVSVFALADVLTGGIIRESLNAHKIEYVLAALTMIVVTGVNARDGSFGLKFVRACSRHKL